MGNFVGMNGRGRNHNVFRRLRRAALGLLVVPGALLVSYPGLAQQDNPGSFTLPAGPQPSTQPPADVQGPVDAESTPPRRTDQPAEPASRPPVTTIAPTPVPRQAAPRPQESARQRSTTPRPASEQPRQAQPRQIQPRQAEAQPRPAAPTPAPAPATGPDTPTSSADPAAQAPQPDIPATDPLPLPELPGVAGPDPATTPETDPAVVEDDGSIWWWAAAGLVALISLVFMGLRQRKPRPAATADTPVHLQPVETVPTPPLRSQPGTTARPAQASAPQAPPPSPAQPGSAPRFDPAEMAGSWRAASAPAVSAPPPAAPPPPPPPMLTRPAAAAASVPAPEDADMEDILPDSALADSAASASASLGAAKGTPQRHDFGGEQAAPVVPRLLLDFTTLGIDVTLVNAVARYHLGITNMSDIPVSRLALHGAIVQARKGMPPTIDPMRGDSLLPHLQKIADIEPGSTQRCEGQIRLPLNQIEPIAMQGRLLFVPLVHLWIGYDGPDGTRYAVTQSFVLGEESTPPGPRVGPLRLDLGPRRFTSIGQRPLQPA
jgi:hypothetical protein